ncbi:hypothetical protein [Xanthomonas floridensis]|uniref:Uncharacterized protein n=1 Tax=Xanthomonas floridensis TaxID=1843580 RepID=A0A1A9MB08_9XANT|nr:hypothetical protein [Xanthomonas floridensis]MEA5123317.1 hypothetical protein [Xanthomonas floridensis]MEA5132716.1 hypothetical protein [Xanthomonas floridensis]OAG67714.1 hypothetical protein A7D17_16125 [Xanthomonas floridensis]
MARQVIDQTTIFPDGSIGEDAFTAFAKINEMTLELFAQSFNTFRTGLGVEWVSGTALRVLPGAAYVPSVQRIVALSADTIVPISGVPANTFAHLYLTATGAIEASTTAPSARYAGRARTKTGDASRRYVFSFRVGATDVQRFTHHAEAGLVFWVTSVNAAPFILASAVSATTATTISAANATPVTAVSVLLSILNYGNSGAYVLLSNSEGPVPPSGYLAVVGPGTGEPELPLDASRSYTYVFDGTGNGSFHRCRGYRFER